MKNFLLVLLTLFFCDGLFAQERFFENEHFEDWDSSQGYQSPKNWYSLNVLSAFGLPITLERTTDAHAGNYAVLLHSRAASPQDISGVLTTGPLIDNMGNPDFNSIKVPYTYRPTNFQFYYHADPEKGDSAIIGIILTKWNLALKKADTVGYAFKTVGDSSAIYSFANLTINYPLPFKPDSMFIIASSSQDGYSPIPGSLLYLDDFRIIGGSNGLNEMNKVSMSAVLSPNPGHDLVHIQTTEKVNGIKMFDLLGNEIEVTMNKDCNSINTQRLHQGVYFIQVNYSNGSNESLKWIKE